MKLTEDQIIAYHQQHAERKEFSYEDIEKLLGYISFLRVRLADIAETLEDVANTAEVTINDDHDA